MSNYKKMADNARDEALGQFLHDFCLGRMGEYTTVSEDSDGNKTYVTDFGKFATDNGFSIKKPEPDEDETLANISPVVFRGRSDPLECHDIITSIEVCIPVNGVSTIKYSKRELSYSDISIDWVYVMMLELQAILDKSA